MKKEERQMIIRQLITEKQIETQEELLALLKERGVEATQSTISRDARELKIVKTFDATGKTRYAILETEDANDTEAKLKRAIQSSLIEIQQVEFMLVIRTDSGGADVITNYLDQVDFPGIVGTLAGIDTILIISESKEAAAALVERIEALG